MKKIRNMNLTVKILFGFAAGIIMGLLLGEKAAVLDVFGQIFIKLIRMVVVPLVFFSISTGVASLSNLSDLKRIGTKTICAYVVTTIIACIIGLGVAYLVQPGAGFDIASYTGTEAEEVASLDVEETILSMFPENIIESMAEGDLLPVIVFAVFLGVACAMLGDKAEAVKKGLSQFSDVMLKITGIVMNYAPIGIFALMACTFGTFGISALLPMLKFVLCTYLSFFIMLAVVYALIIRFIVGVPVLNSFRKILPIMVTAFSTQSSNGTLPVTLEVTNKKLGVSEKVCSFTLPLGATINMHGTIICLSTAIVFVSKAYGIYLSPVQIITFIGLATILSIGAPGVPGGFTVTSTILLTSMGMPLDLIGMLSGIDRIIDLGATVTNVTGDVICTMAIAKSENLLDYNVLEMPSDVKETQAQAKAGC